jgi:hypothetical protein
VSSLLKLSRKSELRDMLSDMHCYANLQRGLCVMLLVDVGMAATYWHQIQEKTRFESANLEDYILPEKVDMLISVETVEHLENKSTLPNFVDRNCINHIILTYPSKKTTHYNKYHVYDFNLQDVLDMFDKFTCYRHFNWEYEFDVVFLIRNP